MLAVLEVVRRVFWNDSILDRRLLPLEASLESSEVSLSDLATMTGAERIEVFKQCGIQPVLFPVFLRAVQHLTTIYGPDTIADNYLFYRHISARQFSPFVSLGPILGQPFSNSNIYKDNPKAISNGNNIEPYGEGISDGGSAQYLTYNGLLNQGATCYLNSMLQAFFHLSEFRSVIYRMPTRDEAIEKSLDSSTPKSIPYALQRLFCLLQTGHTAVGTKELTEAFGWASSDSFIQHDVHELTRVLLDNLEEKLAYHTTSSANDEGNAIHRLFRGVLETFIKVDDANYYGSREEDFYDLQLVIKNKKDIYSSFDAFFQIEILDGKNKYCLEREGSRSYHRAEKGTRFKKIPPIMLLHLARFDFDLQLGGTKILTRWDYFSTLDLSRYLPDAPSEDTHYTLTSVLVHSGSNTVSGHYYCFLRCSGNWYKFNDETVSPATLKDVFGANFGGCNLNSWGSEVPHTTNAYMLVYIRTSQLDFLLRPIGQEDLPVHVTEQLELERVEYARRVKEQTEDHLYGRLHFIQPQDIAEEEEFLTCHCPIAYKFPAHRTLRIPLEEDAYSSFNRFIHDQLGITDDHNLIWFASCRRDSSRILLQSRVVPGLKVSDILGQSRESCLLIINSSNGFMIELDNDESAEYQIFHHKLYDPLQLKVYFLGSTVIRRNDKGSVTKALQCMEPCVRKMIGELPDESKEYVGHHLRFQVEKKSTQTVTANDGGNNNSNIHTEETSGGGGGSFIGATTGKGRVFPKRGEPVRPLRKLTLEIGFQRYVECRSLSSGDILVWQEDLQSSDQSNVFYDNVASFQHFLKHRIPVDIKLNQPPHYPTLVDTELAEDMTYEQLQRYVARLIGDPLNYDRIRFTRYNPDTELPYFMKGKKKDRPTLEKLLTPACHRYTTLSKYLYYEYCKFFVTEIESSHSLQFKVYDESVKAISSHWILIPRSTPIHPCNLFRICVEELRSELNEPNQSNEPLPPQANHGKEDKVKTDLAKLSIFLRKLNPELAWQSLRLVDVWKGRIYNVFDKNHTNVFSNSTFEESSEYRIERIPEPIADLSLETQTLIHVHHFTTIKNRKDPVETHSKPFSIYISHIELPGDLLKRIAEKIQVSYAAVQDWKICLVKESRVVEVVADVPMGVQLLQFCDEHCYLPNQKEPAKMAFLGLEHAPTSTRLKREEKVVILN